MSGFFDYCVNCGIMFTDREKFLAHKLEHEERRKAASERRPISEVEERIKAAAAVPGAGESKEEIGRRLAAARLVNSKRKKLIAAGIEAATMNPQEVEARYAEEKQKGTVK
nr:MAG TPA: NINTH ZINC-FINGER DOMAIN OF THE-finger, beta-hairpin + alpha-helix, TRANSCRIPTION [Caudoviricetes sp.]